MYKTLTKMFFNEARCLNNEANKSFEALFDKLDVNKDGKVDIVELREGLAAMGFSLGADAAQKIVSSGDSDKDEQLDFAEFANYLKEHEKKLDLTFKSLDKNNDGTPKMVQKCGSGLEKSHNSMGDVAVIPFLPQAGVKLFVSFKYQVFHLLNLHRDDSEPPWLGLSFTDVCTTEMFYCSRSLITVL